jgi:hypothetical protein
MKKAIDYTATMFINGTAILTRDASVTDIVRNFWRLASVADHVDCEVSIHDDVTICSDYGEKPGAYNGRVEYYYTATLWNEGLHSNWDIELEIIAEHYWWPEA